MSEARSQLLLRAAEGVDLGLCLRLSRVGRNRPITSFLALVSRLGDGVFWYGLMLALPLVYGHDGTLVSARMLATAVIGLLIYRYLKSRLVRERPYVSLG